jgi:hypothetical protein
MPALGSPGDLVAVTLDCDAGTLSLSVNGEPDVVVARDLPAGVYFPVVSFYNEYEKSVAWLETVGTSRRCGARCGAVVATKSCGGAFDVC